MIKATKDFVLNNVAYEKGDVVEVKTKEDLIKLNEKGFIEPLTLKQIQNFDKEKSNKNYKKEEEF